MKASLKWEPKKADNNHVAQEQKVVKLLRNSTAFGGSQHNWRKGLSGILAPLPHLSM
jgi:hypothetical protein